MSSQRGERRGEEERGGEGRGERREQEERQGEVGSKKRGGGNRKGREEREGEERGKGKGGKDRMDRRRGERRVTFMYTTGIHMLEVTLMFLWCGCCSYYTQTMRAVNSASLAESCTNENIHGFRIESLS